MKGISHQATISSITAKVDGSVGYKINTPELSSNEKSIIFDLQNQNVEVTIVPLGEKEIAEIKTEKGDKTPSQRLRAVWFVLWSQNKEGFDMFDSYYQTKMNKIIEKLKERII
jgi:hypothetical protein